MVLLIDPFQILLGHQTSVDFLISAPPQTAKTGHEGHPFPGSPRHLLFLIAIFGRVIFPACGFPSVRGVRGTRRLKIKRLGGLDRFDAAGFIVAGVLVEDDHGLAVAQVDLLDVARGYDDGREGAGRQQGQQH